MLETHRLVTLVGAGGIGKTRTSLQVAANQLDGLETGVWFVELAPLTSGDYVPSFFVPGIISSPMHRISVCRLLKEVQA